MSEHQRNIIKNFGDQLRVRVCGICIKDDCILMVRHQGLAQTTFFWSPPGGGMDFGYSAEENLIREFKEETGLDISVTRFLFVHEFLDVPLHAIELFFEVEILGGNLKRGADPELGEDQQIIDQVSFLSFEEFSVLKGTQMHNVFNQCDHPSDILSVNGYLKFENKSLK